VETKHLAWHSTIPKPKIQLFRDSHFLVVSNAPQEAPLTELQYGYDRNLAQCLSRPLLHTSLLSPVMQHIYIPHIKQPCLSTPEYSPTNQQPEVKAVSDRRIPDSHLTPGPLHARRYHMFTRTYVGTLKVCLVGQGYDFIHRGGVDSRELCR
jgi:hypothetical protein